VGCGDIYWIDLAHDRDRWWALVNFTQQMNIYFIDFIPHKREMVNID
jgi:hypothetical protein